MRGETLTGEDSDGNARILVSYRFSNGLFRAWVTGHGDNLAYYVTVSDAAGTTPDAALAGAETHVGLPVTSSKAIEHDGLPGKDIVASQGKIYERIQFFAARGRVYGVVVSSTSLTRLDDGDAKRFFESLSAIKPAFIHGISSSVDDALEFRQVTNARAPSGHSAVTRGEQPSTGHGLVGSPRARS